ncbi:MAG: RNA polymerase sigma factor, partial [Candidatus Saccharibacteria bacterium]
LVFNMKYFDEIKYEDMATILDTSVGALKASYHHAVKKVEEYLKSHETRIDT